jgi:acetolactate synthase-1/2/3 large subunit
VEPATWGTLTAAFNAGGVRLVAVPVDYSENTRVLVEELGALAWNR